MPGKFMQQAWNRDYSKFWQDPTTWPAMFQAKKAPIEGRPYSVVENYKRAATGNQPYWMPIWMFDSNTIWPDAIEEHPVPEKDGYDWWGVDWKMEPNIGGMITNPGTRTISDFANWKEELEWPDISGVDFATDGKKLAANLDPDRAHIYECTEGLFERLHELIPFDESLLAFYMEPELLDEFFTKMADYKIETCQKVFDHYGRVDGVLYHDDWGAEKAGFFSNEMFREQLFPQTKRFFDFLHANDKFIELHSCGNNAQYVPLMIEMGIDHWTPQWRCNNLDFLYETYGEQMSFTIPLNIPDGSSEDDVRGFVKEFVDRYCKTGRIFAHTICNDKELLAFTNEEIFRYSYEVYNRIYGR